ncbi:MAG: STAS domain-containing protein [Burkholderiales bacterium]|nr:STAS domain-containing protein [Burkholderiales bacterium]
MAEGESFFRKVVRFVANPATDWADLASKQEDSREFELEKSELKAMVERKRRNDFVRKREFDMLRKVRREGLTPEQLQALGSARVDDSEARQSESAAAKPDGGVKAKIDEIEKQMEVGGFGSSGRHSTGFSSAPTEPAVLARSGLPPPSGSQRLAPAVAGAGGGEVLPALPPLPDLDLSPADEPPARAGAPGLPPLAPPTPVVPMAPLAPLAALALGTGDDALGGLNQRFGVEVSEVVHDPELDEAVIAFANADFSLCEQALVQLTGSGGVRSQHAETWLVLFDLYRATGEQPRFEALAGDYAHQFGWSAPQWFSLPKLVAEAVAESSHGELTGPGGPQGEVGWVCPERLDLEAVAQLRSQTLQMPLPWAFDWSALRVLEPEAATQLSSLFRHWSKQPLEMHWLGGDNLFSVLQEAAPTGVRDADPAFWQARLDALKLANRADQFDEAAIDYCVTYEVSPPSWEHTRCAVRISGSGLHTHTPPLSLVSEVSTGFMESGLVDEAPAGTQVASIELSGQLVGDISETLNRLTSRLGSAQVVQVSCARLIRVDFIAAGDLLNWVLVRRGEGRSVHFVDAHRLVALFFGAMGINEHARVQVRKV